MTTDPKLTAACRTLAQLQTERASIIDQAAKRIQALEQDIEMTTRFVTNWVKSETAAETAADLLAEYRIHVGELNSTLVDGIEQYLFERTIHPEPYIPIRARWALVENRH